MRPKEERKRNGERNGDRPKRSDWERDRKGVCEKERAERVGGRE